MVGKTISLQRFEVASLAERGRVLDAAFIAGDYEGRHGFLLNLQFGTSRQKQSGVLVKQDGDPRLFVTPQTCTKNAQKLGLTLYRFDTTNWEPQHYDPYDAQVRSHRKKRSLSEDKQTSNDR